MELETISAIVGAHDDTIELSFDPVHAGCIVWYRYPEVSGDWQSSPFQAADLRHLSDQDACEFVDAWVG
jgi:hypothetical protein